MEPSTKLDSVLTDWFRNVANTERVRTESGEPVISSRSMAAASATLFADQCMPEPFAKRMVGMGCTFQFLEKLMVADAARRGETITHKLVYKDGISLRGGSISNNMKYFTSVDVCEWLWNTLADYIDAKIKSLLPRAMTSKRHKSGQYYNQHMAERGEGWPHNDKEWEDGARRLLSFVPNSTGDELTPVSCDVCCEQISELCVYAFNVSPPVGMIRDHIGPLCQHIEPSLFLARTLARCGIMSAFLGDSLTTELRSFLHSYTFDVPQRARGHAIQHVVSELVRVRSQLVEVQAHASTGDIANVRQIVGPTRLLMKSKPTLKTFKQDCEYDKRHTRFELASMAAELSLSFKNIPATLGRIRSLDRTSSSDSSEALSTLASNKSLRHMVLTIDEAVDVHTREKIAKA